MEQWAEFNTGMKLVRKMQIESRDSIVHRRQIGFCESNRKTARGGSLPFKTLKS
jgi:hypothetical protein